MRTDVSPTTRSGAGTVVGEAREVAAADQPEVGLHGALAGIGVGTEPGFVSVRVARDTKKVRVGLVGGVLGITSGGFYEDLLGIRAARVRFPLVVGAGDSKVTRELNPSNFLNSGVEVLGGAIRIDVGEQA